MNRITKITAFLLSLTFSLSVLSAGIAFADPADEGVESENITEIMPTADTAEESEDEFVPDEAEESEEPDEPDIDTEDEPIPLEAWWEAVQDGDCFDIAVKMFRWPYDDPPSYSMGNGALTGEAKLVKEDGTVYAEVYFQPIDMGSTIGHLIKFWHIPDQSGAADRYTMAAAMAAQGIPAENQSIDTYLDVCAEECEYIYNADGSQIEYIRLPLENDEEQVVCGIESDFSAMGRQLCVMRFDYSNAIEAITGVTVEKAKQVGTPVISTILSAEGDSFDIAISIPKSAEAPDAAIYYMVSGSDDADISGIISEENRYKGFFEISQPDLDAFDGDGSTFNVYAIGVKEGYENSVVNLKKITFYNDLTVIPTPTASPQTTDDPSITSDPNVTVPPETQTPSADGSGSTGGGSSGDSDDNNSYSNIADGKYRVTIALYHASADQLSMGNSAFENNNEAIINIVGGNGTITCASNPVSISPYYSALQSMLFKNSNGDWQRVTSLETKTITAEDGTNTHSLSYLAMFSFKLPSIEEEYVPVKINVPYTPMDEISDDGYIEARLRIYWNTLTSTDTTDKLTPNTTAASGSTSVDSDGSAGAGMVGDAMDVTDRITGIRFTTGMGVFQKGTKVFYNLSPVPAVYTKAEAVLGDSVNRYKLYVISARRSRKTVQPSGYVTFYVPIGDIDIDKSVIYKITDETENAAAGKTMIDFEISFDGEYFVFSLNTLGTVAICETDNPPPHRTRAPEPTPTPAPELFEDIGSCGSKAEIELAVKNGWFNGIDETHFGPGEELTRAMFITVLGRFCGGEASIDAENPFSDVPETEYYFPYVLWAYDNGIVSGTVEDLFEPYSPLTREQMAVILYNFVKYQEVTLRQGVGVTLKDAAELSEWAAEPVMALVRDGLMSLSDRIFAPKSVVRRVEAVLVLCRLNEIIEEQKPEDEAAEEFRETDAEDQTELADDNDEEVSDEE